MRLLTWNCNRAQSSSRLWDYFRSLDADIALLQEVGALPENVTKEYSVREEVPVSKAGNTQKFMTVLLVRGTIGQPIEFGARLPWVSSELDRFGGNVFGNEVHVASGEKVEVVNVHSPAWPVPKSRWQDKAYKDVKLTMNRDVWVADLLWYTLGSMERLEDRNLVVGGDFNLSETFDAWKSGPRGNREYLDRMAALGFTECLRHHNGRLMPTFRNLRDRSVTAQIDHLFVTPPLARRLASCTPGDSTVVFGEDGMPSLSDHLPVVAEFSN